MGADPAGKTALADLNTLFKDNLGGKLDNWLKRQNNPEDIYGLAWQLVATLREYKTSATGILDEWRRSFAVGDKNGGVAQFYRESMDQLSDSIIGAVAKGLDDDIEAGQRIALRPSTANGGRAEEPPRINSFTKNTLLEEIWGNHNQYRNSCRTKAFARIRPAISRSCKRLKRR